MSGGGARPGLLQPDVPRHVRGLALVAVVVSLTGAGGCSGSKAPPRKTAATVAVGETDPESAITVDGGRVSVRSPVGWSRSPRSDDYVVRYTPSQQKTFPAIVVTGTEPAGGIGEVTTDNHSEFVAAVAAELAETFSSGGKSTLLKKPAAVRLGTHLGAAWTAPGTAKVGGLKQPIERSCVAVVVAGRMYVVEARAPKGKLDDEGREAARGVAAAIAPPAAGQTGAETSATEPPAQADAPAAAE